MKIFFLCAWREGIFLIFLLQNILPLPRAFTTLPVAGFFFFFPKKYLNDCSLTRQLLESRLIFTLMISETSPSTSLSANLLVELRLLAVYLKRPFSCKWGCLLSAPMTAQALTCFLCFALVGINSKLATVQEQLLHGENGLFLQQNYTHLQAWSHSLALVPQTSCLWVQQPLGEIPINQRELNLALLQQGHWRLWRYSQYLLVFCMCKGYATSPN